MKKISNVATFLAALLLIQGCATDKPLVKRDLASLTPLKVVRHNTPEIKIHTVGGMVLGGLLFGGFGMEAVGAARGKALREQSSLPDYGQLVMSKVIERLPKEIPDWPRMIVEDKPVESDYVYKPGFLLAFDIDAMTRYSVGPKGFNAITSAEMHGPNGDLIWRKQFFYSQHQSGRDRELNELEADNAKLLKEEMDFAAEKTVTDFIEDLRRKR